MHEQINVKQWRAWVIKRNRIDNVIGYIRESVPEIDKYFYPRIKKEYKTKSGIRVKERPLYEGYIFLRYNNADQVFHKLRQYPFITTFAGVVTEEEIRRMEEAQGKLITELRTSKFKVGDVVTLLGGPFKGFEAAVQGTRGAFVEVKIDAHILGQTGIELVYAEEQLERKSQLQSTGVQDI